MGACHTRFSATFGGERTLHRASLLRLRQPGLEAGVDLVTNPPEHGEPRFLAARRLRGIFEAPVDATPGLRKHGACLVGAVADGDDVVPGLIEEAVEGF